MRRFLTKSIWLGAALFALGCAELGNLGPPTPPTPAISLYGGDVIAAVPEGYCIETKASNSRKGFAVMVACEAISGDDDRPDLNGFVTVQVGQQGTALVASNPDGFLNFLNTAAGESMLSVNGSSNTVTIESTKQKDGAVTVQFTDHSAPPVAGLQTTEWRAFVDIKGRLTTIAVRGVTGRPLSGSQGQVLLESVLNAMLVNNRSALEGI